MAEVHCPSLHLRTGQRNSSRELGSAIARFLLEKSLLVSILAGAMVAFPILVAETHAHFQPWWWLHGAAIALGTGLLVGLSAWLHLREVKCRAARLQAVEKLSHDVRNALQILMYRGLLPAGRRAQIEDEAIERIHSATRQVLPDILGAETERPIVKMCVKLAEHEPITDACA